MMFAAFHSKGIIEYTGSDQT